MILCSVAVVFFTAAAARADTIQISATYNQSEARRMLSLINSYRAENGVQPLTFDYTLEKIAMQRAAEIAVSYSHTRPNGEAWGSLIPLKLYFRPDKKLVREYLPVESA